MIGIKLHLRKWLMYRLMFDGERIQDEQTASDLGLQEGDSIDVLLERESTCRKPHAIMAVVDRARAEVAEVGGRS